MREKESGRNLDKKKQKANNKVNRSTTIYRRRRRRRKYGKRYDKRQNSWNFSNTCSHGLFENSMEFRHSKFRRVKFFVFIFVSLCFVIIGWHGSIEWTLFACSLGSCELSTNKRSRYSASEIVCPLSEHKCLCTNMYVIPPRLCAGLFLSACTTFCTI